MYDPEEHSVVIEDEVAAGVCDEDPAFDDAVHGDIAVFFQFFGHQCVQFRIVFEYLFLLLFLGLLALLRYDQVGDLGGLGAEDLVDVEATEEGVGF
jgi:hypothetical protein